MPVGISFGAATSGNGFDVAATVASIMAVERTPETAWATQTAALQAQDTVLSTLSSNVASLSGALSTLTSFDGAFSGMTGATSDSSTVALTSVGTAATAGSHTITVNRLAQTARQNSSAVAPGNTVSGQLRISVGGAAAVAVDLGSGGSGITAAQAAAAINNSGAGVTATVITDSSGSRISLASKTQGAAGELSVDSSSVTDSGGAALSFTEAQAGQDASFTLDGISLTSQSNTVASVLPGITFQLLGTSSGSGQGAVLMDIAHDTSSVSTALSSFVSAYNTLAHSLSSQEAKDTSGNPEPLYGNPLVSQMQSRLSTALGFTASSATTGSLTLVDLGITTNVDGTLSLDTAKLSGTLATRLGDVESFFETAGNFGQNLVTTVNSLGASQTGSIALAQAQNAAAEQTLAANKADLEDRLAGFEASLTAELSTANEILQAIPTQLSEIKAMFNAINGTNT